jgi:hypothetical protein
MVAQRARMALLDKRSEYMVVKCSSSARNSLHGRCELPLGDMGTKLATQNSRKQLEQNGASVPFYSGSLSMNRFTFRL